MNTEKYSALLKGVAKKLLQHRKYAPTTGGTINSRYCYAAWLRHLIFTHNNGVVHTNGTIAELGPGDSIGIGLTALLTGYEKYIALDVYKYWDAGRNVQVFDELVALLTNKTPIPADDEFSRLTPTLTDYSFPSHILSDALLEKTLDPHRIEKIRNEIANIDNPDFRNEIVTYYIPWNLSGNIDKNSVDFFFSQAVMQYIDDLDSTYHCMQQWMKPGAAMSHSIDFSSHGITSSWNGHWTFSDAEWKLAHGNNVILLNRAPLSRYLQCNNDHGFEIVNRLDYQKESRFTNQHFHNAFKKLTKLDYNTFVSVIISRKKLLVSKLLIFLTDIESAVVVMYEQAGQSGLTKAFLFLE